MESERPNVYNLSRWRQSLGYSDLVDFICRDGVNCGPSFSYMGGVLRLYEKTVITKNVEIAIPLAMGVVDAHYVL